MLIQILITIAILFIQCLMCWVLETTTDQCKRGINRHNLGVALSITMLLIFVVTYVMGSWKIAELIIN